MTNIQQRRRHLEEAELHGAPPGAGREDHWQAGAKLNMGGVTFPRGSTVPHEVVASLSPGRLSVLMGNKMLIHRLGPPDPNAPAAEVVDTAQLQADDAALAAAMKANMERAGYYDRAIVGSSGRLPPAHPSAAIKPRST